MPINPTTLKALIDTQITNETVDFAITPTEVGSRMKDTIDYTTEQIAASELLVNKSTNVTTDGASDTKYPSVKAVKTYVDANAGVPVTKVLKTTITSAQILSLFDTPITVLDSTNPLTIKLPINIWVQRKVGNAYTLAAASFSLINDIGGSVNGNLNPNPLGSSVVGFFTSAYSITQNSSGVDRNALYKLKANSGNPTGGTGDIDVYVTYIEIAL